jgi:hypothetical protein
MNADGITAISARASKDYVRARLPNGAYQQESYAFGDGGFDNGSIKDVSIDSLRFNDIAHVIAKPLANENYVPARDPNATKLLIMVYWGLTEVPPPVSDSVAYTNFSEAEQNYSEALNEAKGLPPGEREFILAGAEEQVSAAMSQISSENRQRDVINYKNGQLLGFGPDVIHEGPYLTGPLKVRRDDLVAEIEDRRYFVVLMAYDFQMAWKLKKHKLLWETRFSIRQRSHQFDADLAGMAKSASKFFGQDSNGLVRGQLPEGHVEVGNLKSLGDVPAK